jgi:hypothetical protein
VPEPSAAPLRERSARTLAVALREHPHAPSLEELEAPDTRQDAAGLEPPERRRGNAELSANVGDKAIAAGAERGKGAANRVRVVPVGVSRRACRPVLLFELDGLSAPAGAATLPRAPGPGRETVSPAALRRVSSTGQLRTMDGLVSCGGVVMECSRSPSTVALRLTQRVRS